MDSIWNNTSEFPHYPPLVGDHTTDVLVIGGGLAGLLCAYYLHQAHVDYILVEADRICSHTTGNTTAKITCQHGLIYSKLIREYGIDTAKLYWNANHQAMQEYEKLFQTIDCDAAPASSYLYTTGSPAVLQEEMAALNAIECHATYFDSCSLPLNVTGAICFPNQMQSHPLKFCAAISKDLNIYENTKVLAFDKTGYQTNHGRILAKKAIVATHFPIFNKHGLFPLKLYQERSYVIAYQDYPAPDGMYLGVDADGYSFRKQGSITLLGGGGKRTGKECGGWAQLEDFASQTGAGKEVARWATQDCMTLDGIAYIGQYSPSTPNLYVATGFNKWGMTSSMAAALLLRDQILGRDNPFTGLYSPSRSVWHPQLWTNSKESTANLLRMGKPRCPHLGCSMNWNTQEHSWDCPCHGSRFDSNGKMLDNPANGDMP